MNKKIYKIDEEITRWAFEVKIKKNPEWFIAFTNPTAGPWKRIEATDTNLGEIHEVYRFKIDEPRPDIVIYNDKLEKIIIFEAKKKPEDLLNPKQISKSCEVMINMSKILSCLNKNNAWKSRVNYEIIMGLLWFDENKVNENDLFSLYTKELSTQNDINNIKTLNTDFLIAIKVTQEDKSLNCSFSSNDTDNKLHNPIKLSFNL